MRGVDTVLRYRGREVGADDVAFIRELIARHPESSRRVLSLELCAAWGWVQANGVPRDAVCRGLLLALDRAGQIELPPPRLRCTNPFARRTPAVIAVRADPLVLALRELGPGRSTRPGGRRTRRWSTRLSSSTTCWATRHR
jgi:hypothetical protein